MNEQLPAHVGIIMDGNGRWARKRLQPRSFGHYEGLKAAKRTAAYCSRLGIPFVTFFVFSTENWKRPAQEISYLMELVKLYLKKEFAFYDAQNIRLTFTGELSELPGEVVESIHETQEHTAGNTGTVLNLAVNYGGRAEIVRAVNRLLAERPGIESVSLEDIASHLDHPDYPELDMVIRTAAEQRLSNFLIWQSAYAEYFFTDTLWPDFGEKEIDAAIASYRRRIRKFGGTTA